MGVILANRTLGDGRRSWGWCLMPCSHSSSFSYCSPSVMTTIMDELVVGDEEAVGGSEGNWGSLYSANSDPGYGLIGDPGINGGEGGGGMKTGDEVRGGGTSMGSRERLSGKQRRTSSISTPSRVETCSSIIWWGQAASELVGLSGGGEVTT